MAAELYDIKKKESIAFKKSRFSVKVMEFLHLKNMGSFLARAPN